MMGAPWSWVFRIGSTLPRLEVGQVLSSAARRASVEGQTSRGGRGGKCEAVPIFGVSSITCKGLGDPGAPGLARVVKCPVQPN